MTAPPIVSKTDRRVARAAMAHLSALLVLPGQQTKLLALSVTLLAGIAQLELVLDMSRRIDNPHSVYVNLIIDDLISGLVGTTEIVHLDAADLTPHVVVEVEPALVEGQIGRPQEAVSLAALVLQDDREIRAVVTRALYAVERSVRPVDPLVRQVQSYRFYVVLAVGHDLYRRCPVHVDLDYLQDTIN